MNRMFPMMRPYDQRIEKGGSPPLPWAVAEAIYEHLYAPNYGRNQSLERIAERGGFAYEELEVFARDLANHKREAHDDR